ncbi:hypothetical protein G4V62_04790 [Bacillaceae bacterium SIJ1]|uniref:M50 family metallopeptidase n=1 Tax=Litoribacterium kuwaitense TaxID=1398745 RepID=UPI0013EB1DE3|nr:M50 family metallopeptidase [Litoribacterium kuwaitense]NGP44303.1 hypothetical protein [Litoribacterium kuwaitense]
MTILWQISLFFFVFAPSVILIHEFGHALAGRLLGRNDSTIVLGKGREVFSGVWQRIGVSIRQWWFLGGYTKTISSDHAFSAGKGILIALAGPVINLICAWVMFITFPKTFIWQWTAYFHLWVGVVNLIPLYIAGRKSDGWHAIQLFIRVLCERGKT